MSQKAWFKKKKQQKPPPIKQSVKYFLSLKS